MALTKSFPQMLNEYLPNELFVTEAENRDYVFKNCKKDNGWAAGADGTYNSFIVPFKAGQASSLRYGKYTAAADIGKSTFIRGKITEAKELHGSLIFNQRDLMLHGKVSEQNFLKLIPGEVEGLMTTFKNTVSVNFLSGKVIATITDVTDKATGVLVVTRPERFEIGQMIEVFNGTSAVYSEAGGNELYVIAISLDEKKIVVSDSRGGSAYNASSAVVGYYVQNHDAYRSGNQAFASLRDILLAYRNGGTETYLGYTKTLYPFLQAYNVSGADVTSTNIMEKIFNALVEIRTFGKAKPTEAMMSLRNFGYCMAIVELQKGAFNVVPNSQKASEYGWMEISIGSVKGGLVKLVGIQEMDDDIIIFPDWESITFASDGGIRKRISPNGLEYFEVREEAGYYYITDIDLFGELIVTEPYKNAIMHSIPTA